MPTIITDGVPLAEVQPWYTTTSLTCPVCGCVFQLHDQDVATTPRQRRAFTLTVERSLGGSSILTGPCPSCATRVDFVRPNMVAPGVAHPVFGRIAEVDDVVAVPTGVSASGA